MKLAAARSAKSSQVTAYCAPHNTGNGIETFCNEVTLNTDVENCAPHNTGNGIETYSIINNACQDFLLRAHSLDELILKGNVFNKFKEKYYVLFSKSGFSESLINRSREDNILLIILDDMYQKNIPGISI